MTSPTPATDGPTSLIEKLAKAASGLRAAMTAGDAAEIEKAMRHFREAMRVVEQVGAWRHDPVLKQRIQSLLPELDSTRMLAALLGDMIGQRAEVLASVDPAAQQPLYTGKMRG